MEEHPLTHSPQPGFAVCLRITPGIRAALLEAREAGQALSLQLVGLGDDGSAVLAIGEEQRVFNVQPQNHHDLLQLPGRGSEARVVGNVRQKLLHSSVNISKALSDVLTDKVRAVGEEAARRKQEAAAAMKLNGNQLRKGSPRPTVVKTVQRQSTPPLAHMPLQLTVSSLPPPQPSQQQPMPVVQQQALLASGGAATATQVNAGAGVITGSAPAVAAKKVLQPPKPMSMTGKSTAAGAGGGASTPPPGVPDKPASSGQVVSAAEPEVPASAVEAARQGDLMLMLVALLSQSKQAMGSQACMRCAEVAHQRARKPAPSKEQLKKALETVADIVYPGNRWALKEEVADREASRLMALLSGAAAGAGAAPAGAMRSSNKPARASKGVAHAAVANGGGSSGGSASPEERPAPGHQAQAPTQAASQQQGGAPSNKAAAVGTVAAAGVGGGRLQAGGVSALAAAGKPQKPRPPKRKLLVGGDGSDNEKGVSATISGPVERVKEASLQQGHQCKKQKQDPATGAATAGAAAKQQQQQQQHKGQVLGSVSAGEHAAAQPGVATDASRQVAALAPTQDKSSQPPLHLEPQERPLRPLPMSKAQKAARHLKGISGWDEDDVEPAQPQPPYLQHYHPGGPGAAHRRAVAGTSPPQSGSSSLWDHASDNQAGTSARGDEEDEVGQEEAEGKERLLGDVVGEGGRWRGGVGQTGGLWRRASVQGGDGVGSPVPPRPSGVGAAPVPQPPVPPPSGDLGAAAAPPRIPSTTSAGRIGSGSWEPLLPPVPPPVASPPGSGGHPSLDSSRAWLPSPPGHPHQAPEAPLSEEEAQLWAEVQLVEDSAAEVHEYHRFLASPPPSPPVLLSPGDTQALARLKEQYEHNRSLHVKVKRKYNSAMLELRALYAEAQQAAGQGQEQTARTRRRQLWVRGASYYPAMTTWKRVAGRLAEWLEDTRLRVVASLGHAAGQFGHRDGQQVENMERDGFGAGQQGFGDEQEEVEEELQDHEEEEEEEEEEEGLAEEHQAEAEGDGGARAHGPALAWVTQSRADSGMLVAESI